jgi:hypothetical protein
MIMDSENNNTNPLSFDGPEAVRYLKENLFGYFKETGLDPYITKDWKKGIFKLFGVNIVNMPDLNKENYILLSNHISDFDGIILGLLHPNIKIIAKIGWTNNKELMEFLKLHYNFAGIYRDFEIEKLSGEEKKEAQNHNIKTNIEAYKYLKETGEARHLLIFPQGTISDVNKNKKERIDPSFARIANSTNTKAVNIFLEYPAIGKNTRISGSIPYNTGDKNLDCRQFWIDEIISIQNKLENVRNPILSEKHSQNNHPGEPYFR